MRGHTTSWIKAAIEQNSGIPPPSARMPSEQVVILYNHMPRYWRSLHFLSFSPLSNGKMKPEGGNYRIENVQRGFLRDSFSYYMY